ncbi:hypothetical protein BJ508DRAFT_415869 [Ascobolus immersus RN42]|uniref:Uncharacterized protein n=1 Tax=Ascobolus immersus RN42 TaxID=1160509 RepID=A0A3N4I480_ASCIM|nr:hypothetical protein BJ508DRAFT_415869 [Ascobolus immersus RN42]
MQIDGPPCTSPCIYNRSTFCPQPASTPSPHPLTASPHHPAPQPQQPYASGILHSSPPVL